MTQRGVALTKSREWISYEAYLDADDLPEHTEWVDGEVVPMVGVTDEHNLCALWLKSVLAAYCIEKRLGEVKDEPFQMQVVPGRPGRSPDVFFIKQANLHRKSQKHLAGPADLVIEVVSPGSEQVDRVVKFGEYEAGGVREYWIIDPHRKIADFFQLDDGGRFVRQEPADGVYRSREVEGLWLNVDWPWERPSVFGVLGELLRAH